MYSHCTHTHTHTHTPSQSALGREEELERKLASMQEVLNAARQLASDSMIVSPTAIQGVSYVHVHVCVCMQLLKVLTRQFHYALSS